MNFEKAFDILLSHEGGFVNHPKDPGGATRYGVTQRVARKHGYQGDMRELPLSEAKRIARAAYWDEVKADFMPDSIRFDLFDGAYNSGPVQATKWLQRAAAVDDDGIIGPKTLAAVRATDPQKLAKRYNGFRLMFLTDLGTWPTFGRGWARRVAHNLLES
jgi:lysozyme family protein